MKKLFVIIVLMALVMSGFAQQLHYHFSEVVESGQTLYFLKRDYAPQEVWVTYPCFRDYYANGDHITTYYYGFDKPAGDMVIPATITHNDTVYTVTRIDFSAFYECSEITSVVLPNTLTFIGQRSFLSCHGLTGEIVIPDSVTIIGTNAFFYCNNITSVVFGNNLSEIRSYSFAQCYSLEHISNFPESLTKLDDGAFDRCGNLCDSVVIPPLVTTIGEHAFAGCNIPSVVISEGVTTIERGAFSSCPIGALHVPSTLVSISPENNAFGEGAFHNCSKLQSITVNEANPIYDSRDNCNALIETATHTLIKGCKNTIIPNNISIIGPKAFFSINELNSITIPNSVERLETSAFAGCNSLTTIILPSNITYIGVGALNCCGLTSIVSKSPTPPTAYNSQWQYGYDNSFMGVNRDIPIYIPVGTIDAYQNAEGWNYFTNFIESEMNLEGEWYYEIENEDGTITYQHLKAESDTTINNERPTVIVRSNTQYDRDSIFTTVTHEYVYENNGKVYWWNKELQEFTTLYDLTAEA
ncbi:MAG: leucine-rich repeat domain-containing protein, partial [Prevotella sp.]|nr:leucine-rich repeat domain-containing protein [Prevotella sp.]